MIPQSSTEAGRSPNGTIDGLPVELSFQASVLLYHGGTRLAVADGALLTIYDLLGERNGYVARATTRHELSAPALALAASQLGLVVAVAAERGTDLLLVEGERLVALIGLEGELVDLTAAGGEAIAALREPGTERGRLVRLDLRGRRVVAERVLPRALVSLAIDPAGRQLVLSDPVARRTVALDRQLEPVRPRQERQPQRPQREGEFPRDRSTASHQAGCCCACCACPPGAHGREPDRPDDERSPSEHPPHGGEPDRPPVGGEHEGHHGVPTDDGGQIVIGGDKIDRYPPPGEARHPCGYRLGWEATVLRRAGAFVLAQDRGARRAALLTAADLRVVTEWSFGRPGTRFLSDPSAPVLLTRGLDGVWQLSNLFDLAADLNVDLNVVPIVRLESKTFEGMQAFSLMDGHAPTKGTVKTLVLPVIEGNQTFSSPNLGGFAAYLDRVMATAVRDYHVENSFGQLHDLQFSVFGANFGPVGGPLKLPRAQLLDYYFPDYEPARVELVKTGIAAAAEISLDGRESLTIEAKPLTGGRPGGTLAVPFFALALEKAHDHFPVQIKFLGTERLRLNVVTTAGVSHLLRLRFTAKTIDILNDAEVAAKLPELETYLESVFLDAESRAGVASRVFARPKAHRIKRVGLQFGRLLVTVAGATATGAPLKITAITTAALGTDPLGLAFAIPGTFRADATATLARYLDNALLLAQDAAGHDYTKRLLEAPSADHDPVANRLTTTIAISNRDGGPGAEVKAPSFANLTALFDTADAKPNSATTFDARKSLRDRDDLYRDAFSAAIAQLRQPGHSPAAVQGFHCVLILPVEPPNTAAGAPGGPSWLVEPVWPSEAWTVSPLNQPFDFRGAENMTTVIDRVDPEIRLQSAWALVYMINDPANPAAHHKPDVPLICHEVGHALGFRDLYWQAGYRDELAYLGGWAMMDNDGAAAHHCGFHKLQAEWIPDAGNVLIGQPPWGRVLPLRMPKPRTATEDEVLEWDFLLVPIELWRDSLVGSARAAFSVGVDVPVVQLAKIDLGGDGGIFDLIEARQAGVRFSRNLPSAPAVLITNGIQWFDDARYAVNGWYRRELHLLNPSDILQNAGDRFDLARAPELPAKGTEVELIDRKLVEGDAHVFRVKVTRRNAEFVDLYFSSADPYYKNPDLWVDWSGDNGGALTTYPLGSPVDQGEQIRVHPSRDEPHKLVARIRNRGKVEAKDVKLTFRISDPPGGGDRGKNFKLIRSETLDIPPGDVPIIVPSRWDVPAGFPGHSCLLVEVEDYRIPEDPTGAALGSDDVWLVNNHAQKNVDKIEALKVNPYEPLEFPYAVNNDGLVPELAYLEPHDLPYGMRLTVTPPRRVVPPGKTVIFQCKIEFDGRIIDAGCRNDRRFRIVTWREDAESSVRWGGVEYEVRPRLKTETTLTGVWGYGQDVSLSGVVSPDPGGGTARIRLDFASQQAQWVPVAVGPGGAFTWDGTAPAGSHALEAVAWFEGTRLHAASRSQPVLVKEYIIH